MKKTLFLQLISALFLIGFCSCSSEQPQTHYNSKLLSFNVYEQNLETILEAIAKRYELDLDFDVDSPKNNFSLSVQNASVNDVLKKLSSHTGFFMKVVDGEITVENEMIDEDMAEITLKLNTNLWKDIRIGSKDIAIDEEAVKNFFGPLFSNIQVTGLSAYKKTITLLLLKEDVPFIKKSLLYLNYLEHKRNLVITVWVAEKSKNELFIKNQNKPEDALFAWKLNAGDNISFTQDNGDKVNLNTQLLSQDNNISQNEVFVKLKYKAESIEHNFNFTKNPVQTVNLSDKLSLIAKANWYIEGRQIIPENLNSIDIASYKKQYSERVEKALNSKQSLSPGKNTISQAIQPFLKDDFSYRIVSLTTDQNSDVDNYSLDLQKKEYSLIQLLEALKHSGNASYHIDEFGVLLDCQGTIPGSRNVVWKIMPEPFGESFLRFHKGAFLVNKEEFNNPVVYLPSANAIVGLRNSKILKD